MAQPAKRIKTMREFKDALEKERQKDPEFYDFLKDQDADLFESDFSEDGENDEDDISDDDADLSGSDLSGSEEPVTDDEMVVVDEAGESGLLKPKKSYNKSLEQALENMDGVGDSEDDDDEESYKEKTKITLKKSSLNDVKEKLGKKHIPIDVMIDFVEMFKAAAQKSGAPIKKTKYSIVNATDFTTILKLCFEHIPKIFVKDAPLKKGKKVKKRKVVIKSKAMKPIVKEYLANIILLLPEVQENDVLSKLLLHIENLSGILANYPRKSRLLLKALIQIWIEKQESIKAKTLKCILSIVKRIPDELFIFVFKRMYLTYSKIDELKTSDFGQNGKLDSMQEALAELCLLEPMSAYQNAFLYIREMAIKLRTMIQHRKIENTKQIYCKSFTNRLYLWSVVLNRSKNEENLSQLIYPLTQVIIGCCKYADTARLLPFRLHAIKCLLILNQKSRTFSPILRLIGDTLALISNTTVPKKPRTSKNTQKTANVGAKFVESHDLDRVIKFSKSQLSESSYKTATCGKLMEIFVESIERLASSASFLEATHLPILQIKQFCKGEKMTKTRGAGPKRKSDSSLSGIFNEFRQILRKIDEHYVWLDQEKQRAEINLRKCETLVDFEEKIKNSEKNSLLKFCTSWQKLEERKKKVQFKKETKNKKNDNPLPDSDNDEPPKKKKKPAKIMK